MADPDIIEPVATSDTPAKAGLEDIVVATSSICYLDGERGVLAYRGYDIHDLAEHATFEEVCYLLWHGRLPSRSELGEVQSQLAASRRLPEGVLRLMRSLPPSNSMDTLRTLVSALSHFDPGANDMSPGGTVSHERGDDQRRSATVVATAGRMAAGGGIIDPDPALSHAANFLYMLTGKRPSAARSESPRRRARAARRPRIQCVHVCGACRRGDADRRALGHDGRNRRAEGAASRRREHRCDEPAARDRPGRDRSEGRRDHPRASSRGRRRFRASAIASIARKIRAPRTCGRCRKSCARGRATGAGSRFRRGSSRS